MVSKEDLYMRFDLIPLPFKLDATGEGDEADFYSLSPVAQTLLVSRDFRVKFEVHKEELIDCIKLANTMYCANVLQRRVDEHNSCLAALYDRELTEAKNLCGIR